MKSFFPDVNVWIALAYEGHQHHSEALDWLGTLVGETVEFCRITQLGFLRLLTQPSVMHEEVRSQKEAWHAYDLITQDERIVFHVETDPAPLDSILRKLSSGGRSSAKQWPDAYLAAFAAVENLTLVTFDRGLHAIAPGSILLGS